MFWIQSVTTLKAKFSKAHNKSHKSPHAPNSTSPIEIYILLSQAANSGKAWKQNKGTTNLLGSLVPSQC